ncbi:TetR/AcrR family transcriptional regulator [Antrihabitans sp. YC2-6]|uniref:TetR/AcrR family transcriptional regulator n=1 Tax=Antrihabitans sp. YC2-6 TaxID=2799498 RepID=UPI0018F3C69D|nr:TetR/AcrR family transcriptional regulator [Antrihabitans sp. YC2-6]MBJ8344855.1 TetR/AcrR family transcriptional regulator [Antrihabitans sp. YC2-6]
MPATATPRKRRAYAARVPEEQRRTELLDAALHLVVVEGHNAVTMAAVAEQAGVTKPVVYGLFANRADLLADLLRREQEQALAQLLAVLPSDFDKRSLDAPGDQLAALLERFLGVVREAPERWHCIVMQMPDMPAEFLSARETARAIALVRVEQIARWLLRSLDAPPELDAEIVAHTMVGVFESAARLVLSDPEHFKPERFVASLRAATGMALRR